MIVYRYTTNSHHNDEEGKEVKERTGSRRICVSSFRCVFFIRLSREKSFSLQFSLQQYRCE